MLNPTSLLADALGRNLAETYRRIYGDREPHVAAALDKAARLVIERIASSDALYHDCEHTALVTLCVQDILRGRRLERTIPPSDRSEEHTSELQSQSNLVCRLLLEKKKTIRLRLIQLLPQATNLTHRV